MVTELWAVRPTKYGLIRVRGSSISLLESIETSSGAHRPLSPVVRRPGREGGHLTPSNSEAKNVCSYLSTPPPPCGK
jgi:hypothetical protein